MLLVIFWQEYSKYFLFSFFAIRNDIRSGTLESSPSLGIVVSQLKNCVEYYNREKGAYDALLRQRKALEASLNINQKGNCNSHPKVAATNNHMTNVLILIPFFSIDQQQYETLSEKLLNKQDELKYCIFLTENCLYLLWAHLDFFMLRAISVNPLQFNKLLNRTYDCKLLLKSAVCKFSSINLKKKKN